MNTTMRAATDPTTYQHIRVNPQTLHIGAEIEGVDFKQPVTAGTLQEIRQALVDWKVIFFRDQNLDHAQHVEMARQFGECTIGHAVFGHVDEYPEVYSVAKMRTANANRELKKKTPWTGWHTDITAAINPPMASILRGVTIPPYGGDTLWTNLAAAYAGLSEPMRGFLETLRGVHKFEATSGKAEYDGSVKRRVLVSEHPLVTVHPESGDKVLYVSPSFLKSIVGLTPRESEQLLQLLWEHVVRTEYTVRFKWNAGDIAFWDNRSTSHLAPTDIFESDYDRQLYRITLVGEVPVGVDGKPSTPIDGDPILSVEQELARRAA